MKTRTAKGFAGFSFYVEEIILDAEKLSSYTVFESECPRFVPMLSASYPFCARFLCPRFVSEAHWMTF